MVMSTHCRIIRTFLSLNTVTYPTTTSPSPKPFPFSLPFSTDTSHYSPAFPVSYLIHNFGFSPLYASKLCSTYKLRFKTAENPNSVLTFFKNHGFSDTQLYHMIEKAPWLLSCNPYKRVLPKFEFFHSKGASTSDIVNLFSKKPIVLWPSLEGQIVPAYELYYRFLQSDKATFALLSRKPALFGYARLPHIIRVLIENGVTESNIARFLRKQTWVSNIPNMLKVMGELKDLGFDPSKPAFTKALRAKTSVTKTRWKEKVDAFKKWGWSDEDILEAFRRQPYCMEASVDKINLVMSFWVNQLGWDSLALVKGPTVIGLSLDGRIIPRAAVLQYLLEKGLQKKNASLITPFLIGNYLFLDMFINRYEEESAYLLKLYEEKLNFADNRNKTGMP